MYVMPTSLGYCQQHSCDLHCLQLSRRYLCCLHPVFWGLCPAVDSTAHGHLAVLNSCSVQPARSTSQSVCYTVSPATDGCTYTTSRTIPAGHANCGRLQHPPCAPPKLHSTDCWNCCSPFWGSPCSPRGCSPRKFDAPSYPPGGTPSWDATTPRPTTNGDAPTNPSWWTIHTSTTCRTRTPFRFFEPQPTPKHAPCWLWQLPSTPKWWVWWRRRRRW